MSGHRLGRGFYRFAAMILMFSASTPAQASYLAARDALEISYRPAAAELSDLDGDEDLDLIVVSTGEFAGGQWNGCVIQVYVNPGDGTFDDAVVYSVPDAPYGLAVVDLNGDERADLVTPNAAPDLMQVLINDGAGGFALGDAIGVGIDPVAVVAATLNADAYPDLASADQLGFGVSYCFNNGDGTFAASISRYIGDIINGLQAGDVDGDETNDLVVFGNDDVYLMRNNGFGGFGALEPLGMGPVDRRARLSRFDDDDIVDLVTGARVWIGSGDGTFGPAPLTTGLTDDHVRCWDFNGDGHRDVVTGAGVALADGLGGFHSPMDFDPPPDSGPIACGDFDGDTISDLVRLQAGIAGPSGFAVLLPGIGDGSVPVFPRVPAGDSVWQLAVDDVDGDEIPDALVANIGTPWGQFLNGSVSVLTGNGDGTLDSFVSYAAGDYVRNVSALTFDGDGAPEIVVTNFGDETITLLVNDGGGGFGPPVPLVTGSNPEAIASADFDGDENLDIAVTNYGLGATPASVTIHFGDGLGGVAATTEVSLTGHAAVDLVATDLDGDDSPDLAVACSGRYSGGWTNFGLYVRLNDGAGGFEPEAHYLTTYLPRTVNAADDAGDGTPDLIVTCHGPSENVLFVGEIITFFNDGAGGYASSEVSTLTHDHFTAACADLDADGHSDLVVPHLSASVLTLLWGDGSGTFPVRTHYATSVEPRGIALGDFDGDTRLDVAVAHGEINELGLMLTSGAVTGIDDGVGGGRVPVVAEAISLRIAPNPMTRAALMVLTSPNTASGERLSVDLYDARGRWVTTLWSGLMNGPTFDFIWDGSGARGRRLSPGVYFCRVSGVDRAFSRRVVMLR